MAQKSWRVTVAAAGTAVQGPYTGPGTFIIRGDPNNTGVCYIGNDGADDVAAGTGYTLDSANQVVVVTRNMNEFWFDVATGGDEIEILRLQGFQPPPPME